jgi:hypothetical protein
MVCRRWRVRTRQLRCRISHSACKRASRIGIPPVQPCCVCRTQRWQCRCWRSTAATGAGHWHLLLARRALTSANAAQEPAPWATQRRYPNGYPWRSELVRHQPGVAQARSTRTMTERTVDRTLMRAQQRAVLDCRHPPRVLSLDFAHS